MKRSVVNLRWSSSFRSLHTIRGPRLGRFPVSAASAKDVIVRYYDAYNAGDIDTIDSLLSEDCQYHDMIYEEPFKGR